jgi:hypothetical protein
MNDGLYPGGVSACVRVHGRIVARRRITIRASGSGRARKNTFLVSTKVTAPDCGPEIDDLINRSLTVIGRALSSPAAETLTSGPFR